LWKAYRFEFERVELSRRSLHALDSHGLECLGQLLDFHVLPADHELADASDLDLLPLLLALFLELEADLGLVHDLHLLAGQVRGHLLEGTHVDGGGVAEQSDDEVGGNEDESLASFLHLLGVLWEPRDVEGGVWLL